jgi:asparagine synthase (glutamine-hydrolysing)
LERRGPDRTGLWSDGPIGFGHALLATTPELTAERQPVRHEATRCVITADVRLDNRDTLLATLGLSSQSAVIGDASLILEAYVAWGEACVDRILGDFAFVVWDPRRRALFCARDPFGMRPFYYHHAPGRRFVFASEPRAILVLPQVPYQLNEGRIADFLVPELEWIDYTSTFFDHVVRLPPAHALTVTAEGTTRRRYWTLEPGPELRLTTDEAYADALLGVLTEAVQSRLRGVGPVGAMLSGGLDSSSLVAIARALRAGETGPPLPTFSAVGPDPGVCAETRSVHAMLATGGLDPHLVDHSALGEIGPELEDLSWNLDEPFDFPMVLVRGMYLSARRAGVRVVLDGAGSDTVFSDGTHIVRLLRRGRWMTAVREVRALHRAHETSSWPQLLLSIRSALTPQPARRLAHRAFHQWRTKQAVRHSGISAEFAQRIGLSERFRRLDVTLKRGWIPDHQQELAARLQPNLVAGRERYDRVASALGVEPRDPFLDRRVVAFCLTLPARQRREGGWPKVILRRAMAGRLPDAVRWRPGRQHLGSVFLTSVMKPRAAMMRQSPDRLLKLLRPYVDANVVKDESDAWGEYRALSLAVWLERASQRPA